MLSSKKKRKSSEVTESVLVYTSGEGVPFLMPFLPEVFQERKRHREKVIGTAEYIQQPRIILFLQYLLQTTFHKHNSIFKYKANGHWRPLRNSLVYSS